MKRWQQVGYRLRFLFFLVIVLFTGVSGIAPAAAFAEAVVPAANAPTASPQTELLLLGQSLDADDISAEKISQFIQAYLQVLQLIERRENELQSAELDSESQQIQREIEAQALELIQTSGLTLQEYLQLLSLTNIDPEFGERVAAQLQEAAY